MQRKISGKETEIMTSIRDVINLLKNLLATFIEFLGPIFGSMFGGEDEEETTETPEA